MIGEGGKGDQAGWIREMSWMRYWWRVWESELLWRWDGQQFSYSGENNHYYQMGCGACISDKDISAPVGYASDLEAVLFWNIKKELKPSGLVQKPQFEELTKLLQQSALQPKHHKRITQPQPDQQQLTVLSEENKLKIKWKLLLFCFNDDFYEPQEYDTIKLGLQHPCFSQIQKDLQRTFPTEKFFQSQEGINTFQRLLKRLALYFPSVGYTQGINFIVGYLLVLEFSEEETFWIVVHMAMSPRFLLLGFFQDGFPMSSIYCNFLKFVFKENIPDLFEHFQVLGVAGEAWMFKWFMTYYLYSFPMEIAKQVWTLIMLKGGIGMVYFGFAILKELQKQLLEFDDATDIIGFLQNLKDISTFNSLINIKSLIKRAYSIVISDYQIEKVTNKYIQESPANNNFYSKFFSLSTDKQKQLKVITDWQENLRRQRIQFRTNERIIIEDTAVRIRKAPPPNPNPNIANNIKPIRESRFRIKEEEFKKTKQKNFLQKSIKLEQQNLSITNRSKVSSKHSKTSHVIEIESISNNLHTSNHSSFNKRNHNNLSRIESQESFLMDEVNSNSNREYTQQDISDGELTARNASVHVVHKTINHSRPSREEEVEIFDINQPFKKKKELGHRNPSGKMNGKIVYLPQSIQSMNKKQSQKTVIEINPTNIIYRQETIYSIQPSERQIFETSSGHLGGQSLDMRYRTPQTVKSHQESIEKE